MPDISHYRTFGQDPRGNMLKTLIVTGSGKNHVYNKKWVYGISKSILSAKTPIMNFRYVEIVGWKRSIVKFVLIDQIICLQITQSQFYFYNM